MKSYSEYLRNIKSSKSTLDEQFITESFDIANVTVTEYGNQAPYTNNKVDEIQASFDGNPVLVYRTFFRRNAIFCVELINHGFDIVEIQFTTSSDKGKTFNTYRKQSGILYGGFREVVVLSMALIKHLLPKTKTIFFKGADDELARVYKTLSKNKNLINYFRDNGFELISEYSDGNIVLSKSKDVSLPTKLKSILIRKK
jgi:hypothetical protein